MKKMIACDVCRFWQDDDEEKIEKIDSKRSRFDVEMEVFTAFGIVRGS